MPVGTVVLNGVGSRVIVGCVVGVGVMAGDMVVGVAVKVGVAVGMVVGVAVGMIMKIGIFVGVLVFGLGHVSPPSKLCSNSECGGQPVSARATKRIMKASVRLKRTMLFKRVANWLGERLFLNKPKLPTRLLSTHLLIFFSPEILSYC